MLNLPRRGVLLRRGIFLGSVESGDRRHGDSPEPFSGVCLQHRLTRPGADGVGIPVTGGGSGIGRAIAERFGGAGPVVYVVDISEAAAEETAELIVKAVGRVHAAASSK